jgi:hypothetical protein
MAARDPSPPKSDGTEQDLASTMTGNILIVGDSHCRELDEIITKTYKKVKVYVVSVGRQTDEIMAAYTSELEAITAFEPDTVILHSGHNELAYHRTKNLTPKDSTQTTAIIINAAAVLKMNHPNSLIIVSSVFPRLLTFKSSLRQLDLAHYNSTAERHGRRLKAEAKKNELHAFLNNFLWKSKQLKTVKCHHYLRDGLHLNDKAKAYVTSRCMEEVHRLQMVNRLD